MSDKYSMRHKLWTLFHEKKYEECFLSIYHEKGQRIETFCTIFGAVTSTASVAGWSIWSHLPWLWGSLVMLAQAIQVVKPHLPITKNLPMLRIALPEFQIAVQQLQDDWNAMDQRDQSSEDDEIECRVLLAKHSKAFLDVDHRHSIDKNIPDPSKRLIKKTDDACANFFCRYYGVDIERSNTNVKHSTISDTQIET